MLLGLLAVLQCVLLETLRFGLGFSLLAQTLLPDLLEFLHSLTDESFVTDPRFADPFFPAGCVGDCSYDGTVSIDELVGGVAIAAITLFGS